MKESFRGVFLTQENGVVHREIRQIPIASLPEGDVLVSVSYSDLNYKDGLALLGKNKVVRTYPMVPGIDFVGRVEESASPQWEPGDEVICTGWGMGERHWGGYGQLARVPSEWLVPLPSGLSHEQAMAFGTAGFTAMLCLLAIESYKPSKSAPILVTGASGGVGSVAVALLAGKGYTVYASTGKEDAADYLKQLGAQKVIGRLTSTGRPLESEQWGGAIDTVGGETLAALLAQMSYGSSVAACGLAGGAQLATTVLPFILRGVQLVGIDSVLCPTEQRMRVWGELEKFAGTENGALIINQFSQEVSLEQALDIGPDILAGSIRGRIVIRVAGDVE